MTGVTSPTGPAPSGLRVERIADPEGIVLALSGELDLASAAALESHLSEAERGPVGRIMLDLAGLEFMDSSGLRVIVQGLRSSQANGHRLVLRRAPQQIRRLFTITGLDDRFTFED